MHSCLKKSCSKMRTESKAAFSTDSGHWFWGTLAKSRDIFASVLLSSILINLFILATPMFTMNVYDKVVPNDAIATLWVLAAGIVTVYIFRHPVALSYAPTCLKSPARKVTSSCHR